MDDSDSVAETRYLPVASRDNTVPGCNTTASSLSPNDTTLCSTMRHRHTLSAASDCGTPRSAAACERATASGPPHATNARPPNDAMAVRIARLGTRDFIVGQETFEAA